MHALSIPSTPGPPFPKSQRWHYGVHRRYQTTLVGDATLIALPIQPRLTPFQRTHLVGVYVVVNAIDDSRRKTANTNLA